MPIVHPCGLESAMDIPRLTAVAETFWDFQTASPNDDRPIIVRELWAFVT